MAKPGEVGAEGRAICLYITGHDGPPSSLGKIGMGSGSGDASGYMDMMAEIGGALHAVDKEEEKLTKKKPSVNLLVKRWANYMFMVKHRNALRTARKGARAALSYMGMGGPLYKLQDYEEAVIHHTGRLQYYAKENEKLRRRKIYLQLMDVFNEELRRRRVHV